jgi:predicted dehydrogenase
MNWGLVAYGHIAKKFIASLKTISDANILGIASLTNVEGIKNSHPTIAAYASYDALFSNPDIDIVYISTTHNYHCENVLKALNAGKHVLCEKPMGIHPDEVVKMTALAKEKNLFLMEAIWTRFLPAYSKMKQHVQENVLGDIKLVKADFSFDGTNLDSNSRLKNPAYAAGAIWDVGLYPISFAVDIFDDKPSEIISNGFIDDQGVDIRSSTILKFGKDQQAVLHCGIDLGTIHDGMIFGTKQFIHLPKFWCGEKLRIGTWDNNSLYEYPIDLKTSFSYEISACYEAVTNNWIEHPKMTHRHSVIISEIMESSLQQLKST